MRARPRPTLKARAIAWLAQREHSRSELRLKLLRRARADAKADAMAAGDIDMAIVDPLLVIEHLLDALETEGYLSATRFAASRVHARAARYGNLRIRHELARHGLVLASDAASLLQTSELERARVVWSRKFGTPAVDAVGRTKQARFLAGRGFSAEVITRVVRGIDNCE